MQRATFISCYSWSQFTHHITVLAAFNRSNSLVLLSLGESWGMRLVHLMREYLLLAVLDLAEEVWESFPTCYTAQKNEFILPLWRFHKKVGAKRLLNSL